jgi:hypothetical protein
MSGAMPIAKAIEFPIRNLLEVQHQGSSNSDIWNQEIEKKEWAMAVSQRSTGAVRPAP